MPLSHTVATPPTLVSTGRRASASSARGVVSAAGPSPRPMMQQQLAAALVLLGLAASASSTAVGCAFLCRGHAVLGPYQCEGGADRPRQIQSKPARTSRSALPPPLTRTPKDMGSCGGPPAPSTSAAAWSSACQRAHHGARPRCAGPARWSRRARTAVPLQVRVRGACSWQRCTIHPCCSCSNEGEERGSRSRSTQHSQRGRLTLFCTDRRAEGDDVGPASVAEGKIQ